MTAGLSGGLAAALVGGLVAGPSPLAAALRSDVTARLTASGPGRCANTEPGP